MYIREGYTFVDSFEEGWILNPDPDPCKVCFFNLEWKRFVASSWKLN